MSEKMDMLLAYLDEQKSIFEKEKESIYSIFDSIIEEFRSSVIQVSSVVVFIVTIVFAMLSVGWMDNTLGQILIIITIIFSAILIVILEFFRKQFLINNLGISGAYDNGLWTISELKRSLFNNVILFEHEINFKNLYLFYFCAICSERVKMVQNFEKMLKIKILQLKADNFSQFYAEYEDLIKKGKIILKEFNESFQKDTSLENILILLKPLQEYTPKS